MIGAPEKSAFDIIAVNQNELRNKFVKLLIIKPKTIKEYAKLIQISPSTLSSWALHAKNARINTFIKIASFIEKQLDEKERPDAENL
jgi:predicted transcriptional regulator